jgi:putative ABC transport system substrate-binding protein
LCLFRGIVVLLGSKAIPQRGPLQRGRINEIGVVSARFSHQLKAAMPQTPIVAMTADPVAWGLAASMARPGGNVTGVTSDVGTNFVTKHLELLTEITPSASRVGLLAPPALLESVYAKALREAAQKVGVVIISVPLESPINESEYRRAFAENFTNRSLISLWSSVVR